MTKYESVKAFHKAFQLDAPEMATMPSLALLDLRYQLTQEENNEKVGSDTLTQYLDAIADQLYLVYGDAVVAGITEEQLDRAFREVHESNMSKMWSAWEVKEAQADPEWRKSHSIKWAVDDCIFFFYDKVYVVKNKLGKVVKSPSYKPVDLSWIEKGEQ